MIILIKLIIAHLLGDFVLQPDWLIKKKNHGPLLYRFFWIVIHSIIHGLLVLVLLYDITYWKFATILFFAHLIIDILKMTVKNDTIYIFIVDQILHILSVIIIWQLFTSESLMESLNKYISFSDPGLWLVLLAYLTVTFPFSYLIGKATLKWQSQLKSNEESLKNAGRYIGMLERFLILTFILLQQYMAIGFLIAAKSVFRFGDLTNEEDRKKTEYILIGTLISFSLTIVVGLFIFYFINNSFTANI